ncbi:MAG: phage polymerase-related protein [Prosthecobacter sp.]|nr:phage polymerase-related protein [Prosthecobacter sp.]
MRAIHSKAESEPTQAWVPDTTSLAKLREAARKCTGCPLYQNATQTVFGEGAARARIVIVGEQPGDREDLEGRPFIGPAGGLLDSALADAGISREKVYITNAVKHFKWKPRGKRRLHEKPNSREIAACRPWLEAELRSIRPDFLILMGATAAQTVLGSTARIQRDRGVLRESELCRQTMITIHPSALLRMPDEAARAEGYAALVDDLRVVAKAH